MELHDPELLHFISNTTASLRRSLHDLTTSLDLLSEHLDLSDRAVLHQTSAAMRGLFRLHRIAAFMDLIRQLEAGSYVLSLRPSNVSDFLTRFLDELRGLLEIAGIRLLAEMPDHLILASLDERLVSLLVSELICNAAAHAADRIVRVSVRCPQPRLLVVTVRNQSDTALPKDLYARSGAEQTEFPASVGLGLHAVTLGARCHGGSLVLSEDASHMVDAVVSIRLDEIPESPLLRVPLSPIQDIPLTHMVLSPVLPIACFDVRDLQ